MDNERRDYPNRIVNHYISCWNNNPQIYLWDKGPIEKIPYDFRVLEFPPSSTRNMWTYATSCMSHPDDENPIELHMFSTRQDEGLIELLTTVAYFHGSFSLLGLNHTVNFGRSWQDSSICTHGYISLPYLDGQRLENLYLADLGSQVKFYWLIPVSEKEVKYKKQFGAAALERLFDDNNFDYINPSRNSIV